MSHAPSEIDRSPLLEIAFGALTAKAVSTTAELRIADALSGGPATSAELAVEIDAHAPSLRRLLLLLTALGVIAQTDADRFELTAAGDPLRADAPGSVRDVAMLLCAPEQWGSMAELAASVRTGERAFDRVHGMPVFDFYEAHPGRAATFNAAMAQHTRDAAPGLVAHADFSRFRSVVDVGGGDGTLMAAMLRSEPQLQGIVFDLPRASRRRPPRSATRAWRTAAACWPATRSRPCRPAPRPTCSSRSCTTGTTSRRRCCCAPAALRWRPTRGC